TVNSVFLMTGVYCDEDAEVRVGVIVRPLRGHWRPARGSAKSTPVKEIGSKSEDSGWKTDTSDYDNIANMQFTSQMKYSSRRLSSPESRSLPSSQYQQSASSSSTSDTGDSQTHDDQALVPRCPSTCKCHITGSLLHKASPPPESNRIKLPPDLEMKDKARIAIRNVQGSVEQRNGPKVEEKLESTQQHSGTRSTDSSKEEIRATSRPLPPPPKKYPEIKQSSKRTKSSIALANIDKPVSSTRRKALMRKGGTDGSSSRDNSAKESKETPSKAKVINSKATGKAVSFVGTDSSAAGQSATTSSGSLISSSTTTQPSEPPRKKRPSRPSLTVSRSRLKTVTYKEEAFMSESKSWILLLIFVVIILLYRSSLIS
uniref:AF4/FMR2 family, member 2 n=1 Tax=Haemonchus contortus TaxID=6289 RepID=A0A7I4YSN2_HAECO